MMTGIKRLAAVFAAFSALVSCVSEAEDPDTVSNASEWAFIASLGGNDSRTLVKEDNKIWWSPSDSIRIFYGSQASGKFRSSNDNAVAVTKFTGTFDSAIGGIETGQNPLSFWGVYPYSEESVCDDASVTLRFPTEQEAVEGSFAPGAFPTVAKSDNLGLSFWIVGGGVRFTVERTGIRRAVFRSADGSPVSGVARVSFDDYGLPVVTDVSAPVDSVVVLAPKSGFEPGKAYFATMLPVTHKNGLRISVKTATTRGNGVLAKEISVRRAVFGRLDKIDSALEYVSDMPVPEMVDLGLSVKWASFNLGAESPEEYGEYFAWGETEPKANYSWSTYKWCYNGSSSKLTKYCTDAGYGYNGFVDDKGVLDPEDDAATANLGGKWRMPTEAEQYELLNNCTWKWTRLNGVNGRKVTSKKDGYTDKWIFLPAAGKWDDSSLYREGYYWSSSLGAARPYYAYLVAFDAGGVDWHRYNRYLGLSVRPVYGDVVHVNGISLDKTETTLPAGATLQLTATLTPENAPDNRISWSSSDESVATVSSDGLVTAIALGTSEITATTNDGGFKAVCSVVVAYQVSVPEMVDLGLSVKWASFNLGATQAEESGDYFAWGETEPKADYSWSTYKWCYNGSSSKLTKYCTDANYGYNGFVDDKAVLDPEDDAATANLGGKWRMPTEAEQDELRNKCTWTWTAQNGVNGRLVTGPNGNSIFLPAAGYRSVTSLSYVGSRGRYWSSSLNAGEPASAYYVYFNSNGVDWSYNGRYFGYSVRPVYGDVVHVNGISLDKTEATLPAGATLQLTATLTPENAPDNRITWSSSDESVATVSSDGLVTAIALGSSEITATTNDGGFKAVCSVVVAYQVSVPEMVDLGLSVKWASFNLGATKAEESGDYFAWGETEPKSNYNWSTYKWYMGTSTTLTKYCNNSSYGYNGFTDNKTVLDPEDDAAVVALGGSWRMPTQAEQDELRTKCTWSWTTQNGVNGRLVSGPNGNSIFLPAAGYRNGSSLFNAGFYGRYWSSSLYTGHPDLAYYVNFDSGSVGWNDHYRYLGRSVRPVYGDVVHVSGISLDKTEATLPAGATLQLTATLTPENAPDDRVTWGSSNTSVASVNNTGKVTAIAPGSAKITVQTVDGGYTAECDVTVIIPVTGVSLEKTSLRLAPGKQEQLTATITPSNATEKEVTWSSSNTSVASVDNNGLINAHKVGYTLISVKTTDGGYVANCSVYVEFAVPEIVDLGLPSGVKWASFNLGAESPEEYGEYFAWGETEPKAEYSWSTYKWFYNGIETRLTKYCYDSAYGNNGYTDNKGVLEAEDDAAAVSLGGKWRVPTRAEWEELETYCTWTWRTINGVYGIEVTSKVTGYTDKWIFLPAAGIRTGTLDEVGSYGSYWSSSLLWLYPQWAYYKGFRSEYVDYSYSAIRAFGHSVRPVFGELVHPQSVSLDKTTLIMELGRSATLTATVMPSNATEKSIIWLSSKATVANVSSTGVVTAVSAGKASITAKALDGGFKAECSVTVKAVPPTTDLGKTFVPVDLGLSVKWASFNLGASSPEQYGNYYAWGETAPKDNYEWSTYKWCRGSSSTMTKYCNSSSYGYNGFRDNKTVLDPEDDAAAVALGGSWRMPTKAEQDELRTKCNWTWTTQNGVNGRLVSGPNGNSIFLPDAGYRIGSGLHSAGSYGDYWSSSLDTGNLSYAYLVCFISDYVNWGNSSRYFGLSVRPVSE